MSINVEGLNIIGGLEVDTCLQCCVDLGTNFGPADKGAYLHFQREGSEGVKEPHCSTSAGLDSTFIKSSVSGLCSL